MFLSLANENQIAGGAGLCPSAARVAVSEDCAKEGAHGGTLGSPVLNREDALIMWRDPVREPASA
jgi:hypothetical protein